MRPVPKLDLAKLDIMKVSTNVENTINKVFY